MYAYVGKQIGYNFKSKMKIKNELLRRTFFAVILIAIFVPTFIITKYEGQTGRIISLVIFALVGMYALFEIVIALQINKISAFITTLSVPLFFILPIDNLISIVKLNSGVDFLSILAKRAISGWEGWLVAFLFSFFPIIFQFQRKESFNLNKQMILTIVTLLIPAFAKLFWVYNVKGLEYLAFFMLIPIISDVGGYFGGKFFGQKWFNGKKIAPYISPKKTYAGFVLGTTLAIIFTIFYGYFTHIWSDFKSYELFVAIIFGILLPLASVLGDLFFSLIKRIMQIKDFSNIIPGHGGLMDRLDAFSFVFVLSGILLLFVFN